MVFGISEFKVYHQSIKCVAVKKTNIVKNVPQFKFRYSHYMAEITLHARTAFEFKYLPGLKDDLHTYFGLSYTFWKLKTNQPVEIAPAA